MTATMSLEVEDFLGQQRQRASGIPRDATVGDVISNLSRQLGLPEQDAQGRPIHYGARTQEGDVLNAGDRIDDVLVDTQTIQLTKSVTAG